MATKSKSPACSQHKLLFAPAGFKWAGEKAVGLPIICNKDGAINEPMLRFFGWSFRYKRAAISSMRDEAYILREWLAYLSSVGCDWDKAEDQTMIDWREQMKSAAEVAIENLDDTELSTQRIARKLAVVFTFYDKAQAALLLDRALVTDGGPVSCRTDPVREWACAEDGGRSTTRRKTPDDNDVTKVLIHLRNTGENLEIRDRNWLIGRAMADAGLRREEVSKLTVSAIQKALSKEGIRIREPDNLKAARVAGWNPRLRSFDAIAEWDEGKQDVISQIDELERRGRRNIYVRVTGKGNVTRDVPFPISLIRDLLEIAIWGIRLDQRRRWGKSFRLPGPDFLFLSEKTRKTLTPGTIGNLVLQAFQECEVEGSGHRLRAYFATKLAERLWAEEFANNGFRWDQSVENLVLDKIAEALGHAQVTTTCRHYLDLGRMAYFKVGSKSALKSMRKVVNAMSTHHRHLPADFFEKLTELLERRAAGVAILDDLLDAILADPDYAPPSGTEPQSVGAIDRLADKPKLRVVP